MSLTLKDIVFGPKNPAPLSDPLDITFKFNNVDNTSIDKKFKLELIADVANKRHIVSVEPKLNTMNQNGELSWHIPQNVISGFKGNAGMIQVEDSEGSWRCNCVVMVSNGERNVLNPLE
jgi:hypothetical protein